MEELAKAYNPQEVEDRLYKQWEEAGYFHAEPKSDKKPYSIVIPPPNITGILHMGHALNDTIQDILIRFKRMQGFEDRFEILLIPLHVQALEVLNLNKPPGPPAGAGFMVGVLIAQAPVRADAIQHLIELR